LSTRKRVLMEVAKDASEQELKKAYRVSNAGAIVVVRRFRERVLIAQKLSKKYHPDINPDEAAHEKFIEVAKGE
jgi:DnaJ-related protein SCJ1